MANTTNKTGTVDLGMCTIVDLCVPAVRVPKATKALGYEYDENGNLVKSDTGELAEDVNEIADRLKALKDYELPEFLSLNDLNAKYVEDPHELVDIQASQPLTTQDSVDCLDGKVDFDNDELNDLIDKFEDLEDSVEPVTPINTDKLTERSIDGHGVFDWLMNATRNQLEAGLNDSILEKQDVRDLFGTGLGQAMETAVGFLVQKDQAYWQNMLIRTQMLQAKAELLMFPHKLKLAYAQLQLEAEKVAQLKEQTALTCQQKKLAVEQLAQADLDRKIKEVQIESTYEKTKMTRAQTEGAIKDVKLKDAQILKLEADIKLQAQALLEKEEQIGLLKAQTANAYARVALTDEQIKTTQAQYLDEVDGSPVEGAIGVQKALQNKQSLSYDRDSLYKVLQLQTNGWSAKKTADIGTKSPAAFTAASVDGILQEYLGTYFADSGQVFKDWSDPAWAANNVVNGHGSSTVKGRVDLNMLKPALHYSDYITDSEFDGDIPTNVGNTAVLP